ncbi:A24 family peptidase [Yinghuangia sp. ASG 101]|uniref:prepilin peptidase n=1 Tax=Yinghuangia sp. ASG 101 TaxID=2896848 RepID=UPI001E6193CE|nr:A24 family peptidase [Yinghuangia sp. ASG 101]UGQ13582.1 A24 family peptidase [Yinghuangia sp. ASG 101]
MAGKREEQQSATRRDRRRRNAAALAAVCTATAWAAITALVARRGAELTHAAPLVLAAASPRLICSDLTEQRLRNGDLVVTYTGTLCVITAAAVSQASPGPFVRAVAVSLALLTAGAALTLTTGQFGGGDTKLAAVIGLALGPDAWAAPVVAVLYGFVLAAGAVAVRACAAKARRTPRPTTIPMGPFLLAGALTASLTARPA